MLNSRREFLVANFVMLEAFWLTPPLLAAQDDNWSTVRRPPVVEGKKPPEPDASAKAAFAEQNRRTMKKDVEALYQLAAQLKVDVERNDSGSTLSVAFLRKAEEIEKLAKQIKSLAKA